jgi:triosephosphate isomerase (TIM)
MGRKFFVGGNWKMNGNKQAIDGIIAFLKAGPLDPNVGLSIIIILVAHVR